LSRVRYAVGVLAHFVAGLLSALSAEVSWALCIVGFAGFACYELAQYFRLRDHIDEEFLEFMVGFYVGVALLLWFF